MAFDGIVTKAIINEISELCGGRIDKIFQPNKNEILIGIYYKKQNFLLDICIDAQYYRINLTTNPKQNPQIAPNFCMLLRKNLIGLKIKNIITFDLERLVIIEFEGFDDIDNIISKKLVIELMGKHSNIILLDDTNIIIDSLRHIKENDENYRDVLPHTKYTFPSTNKLNFLDIKNFEEFKKCVESQININTKTITQIELNNISTLISNTFNGLSKNFINAIIDRLKITEFNNKTFNQIYNYISEVIHKIPYCQLDCETLKKDGKIKDYFLIPTKTKTSPYYINFFIDDYYFSKETNDSFKNYRNTLLKLILETLKKYNQRLYNINEKLEECKDMEKYRIYGELITANLYRIPNKNLESIELENYYDNNKIISIKLDKKYLPNINAKKFFKKYSKLKNALEIVSEQKKETIKDLNYIESITYELENASNINELAEIFEEISENDIFKEKTQYTQKTKKSKIKKSKLTKNKEVTFNPIKYKIGEYTILVGRNNKENDFLTLKYANKNDIWFHTKDFPGSHTILKINNNLPFPNNQILIKVAEIAASHSKAKNSSNVPVDYCEVKYVKKPSGSKPGMVIYVNNKTINVTPKRK